MEYKDYYKVLGVDKNASVDDIKRAYRKIFAYITFNELIVAKIYRSLNPFNIRKGGIK